jgi:hypothetical protein
MKDYHRLGAFKQERADAIAESVALLREGNGYVLILPHNHHLLTKQRLFLDP